VTDIARLPEAATSRLGAISLIVPDYDDAIGFFCKGLGWTLCEDMAQAHKRWVTVQRIKRDLSQLVPSLKKSPAMNPMGAWQSGAILGATDGT